MQLNTGKLPELLQEVASISFFILDSNGLMTCTYGRKKLIFNFVV